MKKMDLHENDIVIKMQMNSVIQQTRFKYNKNHL